MPTYKPSCKNCKWYKAIPVDELLPRSTWEFLCNHIALSNDSGRGECHRYPPKVLLINRKLVEGYPEVSENNFCGEFSIVDGEDYNVVQK
jgi:hypothetical protein